MTFGSDKHAAYLRSLLDPRRMDAVRDEAERLNKVWRERTPEEIAMRSRCRKLYADDHEQEADEQGISMSRYLRENR